MLRSCRMVAQTRSGDVTEERYRRLGHTVCRGRRRQVGEPSTQGEKATGGSIVKIHKDRSMTTSPSGVPEGPEPKSHGSWVAKPEPNTCSPGRGALRLTSVLVPASPSRCGPVADLNSGDSRAALWYKNTL